MHEQGELSMHGDANFQDALDEVTRLHNHLMGMEKPAKVTFCDMHEFKEYINQEPEATSIALDENGSYFYYSPHSQWIFEGLPVVTALAFYGYKNLKEALIYWIGILTANDILQSNT